MLIQTTLSTNALKAYFQLLGWLLFNHSMWRQFVNQIDTTLSANFALISTLPNRNPQLKQLWKVALFVQPFVVVYITIIILLFFRAGGYPYSHFGQDLVYGIAVSFMLALTGGVLCSFIVSVPFGILVSGLGSLIGLLFGLTTDYVDDRWAIVLLAFSLSFAGSITNELEPKSSQTFLKGNIGNLGIGIIFGIISGVLIPFVVWFVGYHLLGKLIFLWIQSTIDFPTQETEAIELMVCYTSTAITAGLSLTILLEKRMWGLILTVLLSVILFIFLYSVLYIVPYTDPNTYIKRIITGPLRGTFYGLTFSMVFILAYLLTEKISNLWAGLISGTIACIASFFALAGSELEVYLLIFSIAALIVGSTQKYWLPMLVYPIESAWHLILYNRLEKYPERVAELLSQHASFWHENQSYRFKDLPQILLKVRELSPELAQKTALYLLNSPQSWAVPIFHLEGSLCLLERNSQNIDQIIQIHKQIKIGEVLSTNDKKLLETFYESSLAVEAANTKSIFSQKSELINSAIDKLKGMTIGININNQASDQKIQRFGYLANTWVMMLTQYLEGLNQVESVPNPYICGTPLHDKTRSFAPRKEVIKNIQEKVLQFGGNSLLLYGQRRMGKTTILVNLQAELPKQVIVVFVDLQKIASIISTAKNEGYFFYLLCIEITKSIKSKYPHISLPNIDIESIQYEQAFFTAWLDELEDLLGDHSILLALDEFEALEKIFAHHTNKDAVLGTLRYIAQHCKKIRLIYASAYTIGELGNGTWSYYLVNLQYVHLGYLSKMEACKLITAPIKAFPLRYTPEALEKILDLTHHHPALIQVLCSEIIVIKNGQPPELRLQVQEKDVEEAIPEVLERAGGIFIGMKGEAGELGKKILCFMAKQDNAISEQRLQVAFPNEVHLNEALKLLQKRELVQTNQVGDYLFRIELVRRWFADS